MGLFNRKKQQGKSSKYLVNVKDKKYRQYLEEQFGSLAHKEDIAKIFADMQWASMKNKIDSMPFKLRSRMLQIMIKHKDKLEPDVRANLERYIGEKRGVKIDG